MAVGLDAGSALEKVEALYEDMSTGQAERLMPMIDAAMRSAGIGFADLDRIAVTTGPGTFTGTRIGIAAARAFALATATSVVGISTLQLMAEEAGHALHTTRQGRPIAVTVDAHRGQVYAQVFSAPDTETRTPPQLLTIEQAAWLAQSGPMIFVGSGAAAVTAAATEAGFTAEAALPRLQPNAAFLLLAAQKCPPQDGPLSPLYLRPADAKPQVDKSLARVGA